MPNIPQYSIKLIELLDESTRRPKFPETAQQIALLDESVIRQGCYLAGRRAIVDELILALQEDNADADDSNEETASGAPALGGVILGADGEERESLASAYMAARSIDEDGSDGSDDSGAGEDQG